MSPGSPPDAFTLKIEKKIDLLKPDNTKKAFREEGFFRSFLQL